MNTPTLLIGNKNYSSWSLRPWFFLRKNGIEFIERQLWLDEADFKSKVGRYNSGGKVPVLLDGKLQIWDSLAIVEYAIEHYDCQYDWPQEPAQRAHARSCVCEMHSGFTALRKECPMDIRNRHVVELSDATARDIQRICELWTQALDLAGREGGWLYGDFSVADAFYAPVVFRLASYGVEVSERAQAYMDYMLADETLAEWVSAARRETRQINY